MMKNSLLLCLALLLVPAAVQSADEDAASEPSATYQLKYKFQAGEQVRYEVKQVSSIDTTIEGTTQTADMATTSIKLWRIKSVDPNGEITIEHSVESVDMRNSVSGRQVVTYNSKTDAKPPAGYEEAAKAVGVPLTEVTIDASGNQLRRNAKHPSQTEIISRQLLYPVPAEPIAVGHVWTVPHDLEVILDGTIKKIQARQRFELLEVKDGIALIDLETQVLSPVHNPKIEAQLIQRMSKGKLRFDLDAGRLAGQELHIDERVLGFSSPNSAMHFVSRFTETALPSTASVATAPEKVEAANVLDTKEVAPSGQAAAPTQPSPGTGTRFPGRGRAGSSVRK